ncbi:hypothetical protein [Acholeplasma laidlawii]|uniref:hypothetical protein n=1 Tax=Acholeplasma laidlawii TaxID=2148 RepID=UPI0021F7C5D6|nr:hypothetical protein [Acholeplasma laidlawii]
MKKYIQYLFKNAFLETVIISSVTLLANIFVVYLDRNSYARFNLYDGVWRYSVPSSFAIMLMITLTISLIVILLLRVYKLKSKDYKDVIYALPIARNKLVLSHLIVGFIQVLIVMTITFIGTTIVFYFLSNKAFNMGLIWLTYAVLLLLLIILFGLTQLIIFRSNNIIDAAGLVFAYFILSFLIMFTIQAFKYGYNISNLGFNEMVIYPYYSAVEWMKYLLNQATPPYTGEYILMMTENDLLVVVVHAIVYVVLSTFCVWYVVNKSKTDKVENIGGVTTSGIGYKVINPLIILFSSMLLFILSYESLTSLIFLLPMLLSVYYVMYIIYRRKFRISKYDYLVVGVTILISSLIVYITYALI